MNSKLKIVQQITHLHSSTLSLWEQGYLAGLRDARISINEIREETGASKATISKYTSSDPEKSLRITTAPQESRGWKRKTTAEQDIAVSRSPLVYRKTKPFVNILFKDMWYWDREPAYIPWQTQYQYTLLGW